MSLEQLELEAKIEAILFAAGEPVLITRIAAVLAVGEDEVSSAAERLAERLREPGSGIRLVRLDNMLQLCSAAEFGDLIRSTLEVRKAPRLSPAALEVLSIVAYFQPVTRAYIEQVRGVDSSYTVSLLVERGLIETAGTLDAPGRPTLFRTTPAFLRTFGISSVEELPELPDVAENDDEKALKSSIAELSKAAEGEEVESQ